MDKGRLKLKFKVGNISNSLQVSELWHRSFLGVSYNGNDYQKPMCSSVKSGFIIFDFEFIPEHKALEIYRNTSDGKKLYGVKFDFSTKLPNVVEGMYYGPYLIRFGKDTDNEQKLCCTFYLKFRNYGKSIDEHCQEHPLFPIGTSHFQFHPLLSKIFSFLPEFFILSMCVVNSHFKNIIENYHIFNVLHLDDFCEQIRKNCGKEYESLFSELNNSIGCEWTNRKFSVYANYMLLIVKFLDVCVLKKNLKTFSLILGNQVLGFYRYCQREDVKHLVDNHGIKEISKFWENCIQTGIWDKLCTDGDLAKLRQCDMSSFSSLFGQLRKLEISGMSCEGSGLDLGCVIFLLNSLPKVEVFRIFEPCAFDSGPDQKVEMEKKKYLQILQISHLAFNSIENSSPKKMQKDIDDFVINVYENCESIRIIQVPVLDSRFYKQSRIYYNNTLPSELRKFSKIIENSELKEYLRAKFLDENQNFLLNSFPCFHPIKLFFEYSDVNGIVFLHLLVDGVPISVMYDTCVKKLFQTSSTYCDIDVSSISEVDRIFVGEDEEMFHLFENYWADQYEFAHIKEEIDYREVILKIELKKLFKTVDLIETQEKIKKWLKEKKELDESAKKQINEKKKLSAELKSEVKKTLMNQDLLNSMDETEISWKSSELYDGYFTLFNNLLLFFCDMYHMEDTNTLCIYIHRKFEGDFVLPITFEVNVKVLFQGHSKKSKYQLSSCLHWHEDDGGWGFKILLPFEGKNRTRRVIGVVMHITLLIKKKVVSLKDWENEHKLFVNSNYHVPSLFNLYNSSFIPKSEEKELILSVPSPYVHHQIGIIQDNDIDPRCRIFSLCCIDFTVEFDPFGEDGWCAIFFKRVLSSFKLKISGKFTVKTLSSVVEDSCLYPEIRSTFGNSKRKKIRDHVFESDLQVYYVSEKETDPACPETIVKKIHPVDRERKTWKFLVKFELKDAKWKEN